MIFIKRFPKTFRLFPIDPSVPFVGEEQNSDYSPHHRTHWIFFILQTFFVIHEENLGTGTQATEVCVDN